MIKINDLIEVHNIDCMDYMRGLDDNSFDLAIVDPPYGLSGAKMLGRDSSRSSGRGRANKSYHAPKTWDNARPEKAYFDELFRVSKNQIIFGGNYYALPPTSCWLVWDKDNGATDFADCELAWTNLKRAVRRLRFRWNGLLQEDMANKERRVHPTQKPVPVMQWCMGWLPSDVRTILDPYMGSGSTLVAATNLGKACIGIEREEKYFDIACKRIALAANQQKIPLGD